MGDISVSGEVHSNSLKRILRRLDVLWLGVVATVNLNLISSLLKAGNGIVTLFLLVGVAFCIPQAIAVMAVSRRFPGEGGMTAWVKDNFGETIALYSTWCYWANSTAYVPALIAYCAQLAIQWWLRSEITESSPWVAAASFSLLAIAAVLSIIGFSALRYVVLAAGIAMLTAVGVLGILGALLIVSGNSPAFSAVELFRSDVNTLLCFGILCMGMIGSELGTVIGDEVLNPTSSVMWATGRILGISAACYLLAYGALIMVPTVGAAGDSIVERIRSLCSAQGFSPLYGGIVIAIFISILGSSLAWFEAATRTIWVGATEGWLPKNLAIIGRRYQTPYAAIIMQLFVSAVILVLGFVGAKRVYLFLLELSVFFQLIPFTIMFCGLVRSGWMLPNRRNAVWIVCGLLGTVSCVVGITLSLFTPAEGEDPKRHAATMLIGIIFLLGFGRALRFLSRGHLRVGAGNSSTRDSLR